MTFIVFLLSTLKLFASSDCAAQLDISDPFLKNGITFQIGLLAQLHSGEKVLAVGPYLTGRHKRLSQNIESFGMVKRYLWGGELLILDKNLRVVMNTCSFLHESRHLPGFENNSQALVNWLLEARPDLDLSNVEIRNVSVKCFHVDPGLRGPNYRHQLGNDITIVSAALEIAAEGFEPTSRSEEFQSAMKRTLTFLNKLERDGIIDVKKLKIKLSRARDLSAAQLGELAEQLLSTHALSETGPPEMDLFIWNLIR